MGDYLPLGAGLGMPQPPVKNSDAPDPEQADQNIDFHAYGLAAKAGDTDAMNDIHTAITQRQQRIFGRTYHSASDDPIENAFVGLPQGIAKVGRTLGGWMGLESKEDVAEGNKYDKDLENAPGGNVGAAISQGALTAPLGLGGGALGARMVGGKLAAKGLPAALARWGVRTGIGAGENAAGSAVTGGDAEEGGALGGALSAATGLGGKFVKGIAEKSAAAKNIYEAAAATGKDIFLPISQGGTGAIKQLFKKALPYAFGTETQFKAQAVKAKAVADNILAEHAVGPQVDEFGQIYNRNAPIGRTMEQTANDLEDLNAHDEDSTIGKYGFRTDGFRQTALDRLEGLGTRQLKPEHNDLIANRLQQIVDGLGENGTISGPNLLRARAQAQKELPSLRGADKSRPVDPEIHQAAMGSFDDVIQQTIDENKGIKGKGAADAVRNLENWQKQQPFKPVAKAIVDNARLPTNAANRGSLSYDKLAGSLPEDNPTRPLTQDMHEVFGENPGTYSSSGSRLLHAAGGGAGLATAAYFGHLPAAIGFNAAGNALATKAVQKSLYGDFDFQKQLASELRNNPQAAHLVSFLGRQGAIDNAP